MNVSVAENPREAVVQVRGLRSCMGTQLVHDGLDLDVYRGEVLGLVGSSGSGKSVLLRTILGLRRPDAGTVRVFGADLAALPERKHTAVRERCGVMFQDGALFSSLTISENVRVPLNEHTSLSLHDRLRVAALKIALADLPPATRYQYPAELSGGMRKRAALARALALEPEVVFLDEPTSGLDPITAAAFDHHIRTLHDTLGLTVLMITHDLDSLYAICDRVAVLAHGRVIVADRLDKVAHFDDPWIHAYFQGPRGRAARSAYMAQ